MLMLGLYRTGEIPFRTVYLHGLVRDAKGQKMSKSKGNVISPLEVSDEYGTDALRMGLVVGNTPGTDLNLDPKKIGAYKKFANKLWNITRFVFDNGDFNSDVYVHELSAADKGLLSEFELLAADVTKDIENYRIYLAAEKLYHYIWDRFASEILEDSKQILKNGEELAQQSRREMLVHILSNSLKLLHPFMPFITEEIWSSIPPPPGQSIRALLMVAEWPRP
jgi:valyl-tRNA synthetase